MDAVLPRALAGVLLLLTLGGCSALDGVRRPPPDRSPSPSAIVHQPHLPIEYTVRTASVDVPHGYVQQALKFRTATVGVALFTHCELPKRRVGNHDDCTARLFVTADGGSTWLPRRHPKPVADNHQVFFGTGGELILLAEPRLWYVSTDAGRTFRHVKKEPPRSTADDQQVVAPGVQGRMLVSADRADIWLVEQPASRREFPEIWHLDGGTWKPVTVEGHPASYAGAAPLGHGMLMVSTAHGAGIVAPDMPWSPMIWPSGGGVETLLDGTLQARDDLQGELWLGTGEAAERAWVKLKVLPRS
jgi:hypothetical protein